MILYTNLIARIVIVLIIAFTAGCGTKTISQQLPIKTTALSINEQQNIINRYNKTITFINDIGGVITGKMENWEVQFVSEGVLERNYGRLGSFFYRPSRSQTEDDLFSLNIGKTNLQQFQIGVAEDTIWWYNKLNDTGDCYKNGFSKKRQNLFSQFKFDKIPQLLGWKNIKIDKDHQVSVYKIIDQIVIMCRDVRNGIKYPSRSIHFENNAEMKLKYIILYNSDGTPIIKNEVSTSKKFKTHYLPHAFKLIPLENNPHKIQYFTIKLSKYLLKKYRDSFFVKPSDHEQRFPCH